MLIDAERSEVKRQAHTGVAACLIFSTQSGYHDLKQDKDSKAAVYLNSSTVC